MSTEHAVIEREIFVAASPETVFGFLTDPALVEDWIGVSHELDARPGGLLRIQFSGGDVARGHYTEICLIAEWFSRGVGSRTTRGGIRI